MASDELDRTTRGSCCQPHRRRRFFHRIIQAAAEACVILSRVREPWFPIHALVVTFASGRTLTYSIIASTRIGAVIQLILRPHDAMPAYGPNILPIDLGLRMLVDFSDGLVITLTPDRMLVLAFNCTQRSNEVLS